jgi:hypothetical protein
MRPPSVSRPLALKLPVQRAKLAQRFDELPKELERLFPVQRRSSHGSMAIDRRRFSARLSATLPSDIQPGCQGVPTQS